MACKSGAKQTPHILDEALSWHSKFMSTGTMKKAETFKSAL